MNKENAVKMLLIVWVIFSAGYILNDFWKDNLNKRLQAAYQQGLADSVKTIIQQSEKCEPVAVYEGEKRVELISIQCLQDAVSNNNETNEEGND